MTSRTEPGLSRRRLAEWRSLDELADLDGLLPPESRTKGEKALVSVTVTYKREPDGFVVMFRVGEGSSFAAALAHADGQLPDGTWRRLAVSPKSVLRDVRNGGREQKPTHLPRSRGEGELVTVERRVSR